MSEDWHKASDQTAQLRENISRTETTRPPITMPVEAWEHMSDLVAENTRLREALTLAAERPQTLSAEQSAEDFIQAEVDKAPEPLHRLGAYLSSLLDEDRWATANRMLLGSIFEVNRLAAENVCLRAALEKIAERRFSDAGEPFDEALAIADAALGVKPN